MKLLIRYRSSADEITDRVISDIQIESDKSIDAYCHLRKSRRSFLLKHIEEAKDIETGELIHDIGIYLELKPIKLPPLSLPRFSEIRLNLSLGEASRLRNEDKWALFKSFKYPEIAEVYNKKLWALFENRCFNCGTNKMLELDHHIPQSLGGRLVPGNIVILCHQCNSKKLDKHPKDYYPNDKLKQLELLLFSEVEIFQFEFNPTRFYNHPKEYLLSLGVEEQKAEALARAISSS